MEIDLFLYFFLYFLYLYLLDFNISRINKEFFNKIIIDNINFYPKKILKNSIQKNEIVI